MTIPAAGRPAAEILDELAERQAGDVDWRGGRAFSLAYFAGEEVYDLARAAHDRYLGTNALNPLAFPSLGRLQSEVVRSMAELLHADERAAGFLTTGGSESIILAVKAARGRARERGTTEPTMVLPTTAHASFTKGAEYFGVEAIRVPVGEDYRADPAAMAAAVDGRTALVVASAPSYPQGVVDPVADVAAIAADVGANCHVDACMGGLTLPMLERLGQAVPPFDFRVPGVTSMSVDLHKYGYAAKGASVILHRDKALRAHQTFVTDDWLGGFYASSGVLGTKGGGPVAAAWAVMQHLGEEGYLRLTRAARDATLDLVAGLRARDGVRVLGDPEATLVGFTFDDADAFAVGEALWARGWFCDQQAPPPSLHCTVNAVHGPHVAGFLAALDEALDEVRAAAASADQVPYASLE